MVSYINILFRNLLFCMILLISACSQQSSLTYYHNSPNNPFETYKAKPVFDINVPDIACFSNIRYDDRERNIFDIYLPSSSVPTGLCIYFHGGGFVRGDKSKPYGSPGSVNMINNFLKNGVAYATVNYSFVTSFDTLGILGSLIDCKRALQFVKLNANEFNIDKEKIILMGSSAGAGVSLWLGVNDDMADTLSKDPLERESTRVKAIVCTEMQSSYDIFRWPDDIFGQYLDAGFDFSSIRSIIGDKRLLSYLGADDLDTLQIQARRHQLNMLAQISNDDPAMYIVNKNIKNSIPTTTTELYHHPLQAKALYDHTRDMGLHTIFYIPELGIDTRHDTTITEFVLAMAK